MTGELADPAGPTKVQRASQAIWRAVGDETVVLNPASGRSVSLNRTGAWLWETLDSPSTIDELADRLATDWRVSPERARTDVLAFCKSLAARDLVALTLPR
jgi:hypothetical protein